MFYILYIVQCKFYTDTIVVVEVQWNVLKRINYAFYEENNYALISILNK